MRLIKFFAKLGLLELDSKKFRWLGLCLFKCNEKTHASQDLCNYFWKGVKFIFNLLGKMSGKDVW